MTPAITDTIAFIQMVHEHQVDKAGHPYWKHPLEVMRLLPPDVTDDERHAALLHDVLEDTETTADDLRRKGYSETTIEIVRLVTRPKSEPRLTYMDWIRSIAESGNVGAIRVKLADNVHNSSPERIAQLPPDQRDISKRYERAFRILHQALEKLGD